MKLKVTATQATPSDEAKSSGRNYWKVVSGGTDRIDVAIDFIRNKKTTNFFGLNSEWIGYQNSLGDANKGLYDTTANAWRGNAGLYINKLEAKQHRWWLESFNHFDMIGPQNTRVSTARPDWYPAQPAKYGYPEFKSSLNGAKPFIVFNSKGIVDPISSSQTFTSQQILAHNELVATNIKDDGVTHAEMGNERYFTYSAPDYKALVEPACNKIKEIIPSICLMLNLPAFDGLSSMSEWAKTTASMPSMSGFSIHCYPDENIPSSISVKTYFDRLNFMEEEYKSVNNTIPRLAITEFGIQGAGTHSNSAAERQPRQGFTSALTCADLVLAAFQYPNVDVLTMFLSSGSWGAYSIFWDSTNLNPVAPYWSLRVIKYAMDDITLGTITTSQNASTYFGGYDIRGSVWCNNKMTSLGVSLINRASSAKTVTIKFAPFANTTKSYTRVGLYAPAARSWSKSYIGYPITATAADNSYNKAGAFGDFQAGDTIVVSNFNNGANNGTFTISSKPSNDKIIVTGGTLVNETDSTDANLAVVVPITLEFSDDLGQTYYANVAPTTGSIVFNSSGEASLSVPANSVMSWKIS